GPGNAEPHGTTYSSSGVATRVPAGHGPGNAEPHGTTYSSSGVATRVPAGHGPGNAEPHGPSPVSALPPLWHTRARPSPAGRRGSVAVARGWSSAHATPSTSPFAI